MPLDELCEGPGCDNPATHLEGGKALCDLPQCRTTQQSRFEERKYSDFAPEEGFVSSVRRIEPRPDVVAPATGHHIHSSGCKLFERYPAPPKGSTGCKCAELEEIIRNTDARIAAKKLFKKPITITPIKVKPAKPVEESKMSMPEETSKPKKSYRGRTDPLDGVVLTDALEMHKAGKTMAEIATAYRLPVWRFAQSVRWRQSRLRDSPVAVVDANPAPPRPTKIKTKTASDRKDTRGALSELASQLEAKINELTISLNAIRNTQAMLERYPDILA
jgi:hypothetical protein